MIAISETLIFPVELASVSSGFLSRKPTKSEIDDPDRYPQIEMTYEDPVYDPEVAEHFKVDRRLCCDVMNDIIQRLDDQRITSLEHDLSRVS